MSSSAMSVGAAARPRKVTSEAAWPWTPGALRVTLAANLVAAVLLVIAWYGVSGEARLRDAAPWANLSAIGLVVAAFGNVRLILVARHRIGVRQAAVRRSRLAARRPEASTDDRHVALARGRLYHRPSCRMVAGKPAQPVSSEHALEPCGWCTP
jgi:hypothetical protein